MEPVGHAAPPTPHPDPQLPTGVASQPVEGAEIALNLHDYLSPRPLSTFYFQTIGDEHPHIPAGSILVVDRAIDPTPGAMVVYYEDIQFAVRHLDAHQQLVASDPIVPPIPVTEDLLIFGVVTWVIQPATRIPHP